MLIRIVLLEKRRELLFPFRLDQDCKCFLCRLVDDEPCCALALVAGHADIGTGEDLH